VSETLVTIAQQPVSASVCKVISFDPAQRTPTRSRMRKALVVALSVIIAMHLVPTAFGADAVASQIARLPPGTRIEVRLKDKQKMRGAIGPASATGFTLVDASKSEHQIAFDDVASLRQVSAKSHTKRNVLIGVAIGVAALGMSAGLIARCAPFGCGTHHF
jgi:hypothetical protein